MRFMHVLCIQDYSFRFSVVKISSFGGVISTLRKTASSPICPSTVVQVGFCRILKVQVPFHNPLAFAASVWVNDVFLKTTYGKWGLHTVSAASRAYILDEVPQATEML